MSTEDNIPATTDQGPFALFATSETQEKKGVAIDYGSFAIIVKRASPSSNNAFKLAVRKVNNAKGHAIKLGTYSEEDMFKDMVEIFSKTVIVGWRNVTGKDGKVIDFSVPNCIKLLLALPELFRDIQAQAMSFETFREYEIQEDAKN